MEVDMESRWNSKSCKHGTDESCPPRIICTNLIHAMETSPDASVDTAQDPTSNDACVELAQDSGIGESRVFNSYDYSANASGASEDVFFESFNQLGSESAGNREFANFSYLDSGSVHDGTELDSFSHPVENDIPSERRASSSHKRPASPTWHKDPKIACYNQSTRTRLMRLTSTPSASPAAASFLDFTKSFTPLSRDLFQPGQQSDSSCSYHFGPVSPTSLNASQLGQGTIDILSHLGTHARLQPALDTILGYLEPADLCRGSQVSHSWRNIIQNVPSAKRRKDAFVEERLQSKENLFKLLKKSLDSSESDAFPRRGQPMLSIHNFSRPMDVSPAPPRSPPVSPSKVRFYLFLKEAHKGSGQLFQCPKCTLPSRRESQQSAKCTRAGCQFHFCTTCFCCYHGDTPCPVSGRHHHRRKIAAIGSRESKRNLQRL